MSANDPKIYTVKVWSNNSKHWYQNGQLHREDGPACEGSDGTKSWYQNGQLHREDGPAIETANGGKHWWKNGKLHRMDGPAMEFTDGTKFWWINDKQLTEAEFNSYHKNSCEGKIVEIDGKKYKLQSV